MMSTITGQEARDLTANGASLIDVRSPGEFADRHLDGATNIPVDTIPEAMHGHDPTKSYVLYCRSGARSARAAIALRSVGFESVYDMGSIQNW